MRPRLLPQILCLSLGALGCSGGSGLDAGCNESLAAAAVNQVAAALTDAGACNTAADCVLVQLPCALTACGLPLAAVNQANQADIEHVFSVTAAETCHGCGLGFVTLSETCLGNELTAGQQAGVTCQQGVCAVSGFDGGGF
ncbi:MAG TPA: hypothetical protein VMB50_12765 [Myxococcales bacterium]|nr:hypothetical protein [Myxococcales bacterium]